MPLYVEDISRDRLSVHARIALGLIAIDIEDRTVTPSIAVEAIQHHVRAMLAPEHHDLLRVEGQPSWDKVMGVYVALLFAFGERQLVQLSRAAAVVQCIYANTTRPPREPTFPETVDVSSFRRMAGYVKLSAEVRHAEVNGRRLDLLWFCKYCWRPATSAAKVCSHHSIQKRGADAAAAEYKQAQRLRATFEDHVVRLATQEELAFHNSEFTFPVFFPVEGMAEWLLERRPRLHRALSRDGLSQVTLASACEYLYGDEGVSRALAVAPQALTPVTLRAEAWLTTVEDRPRRGGDRKSKGARVPAADPD